MKATARQKQILAWLRSGCEIHDIRSWKLLGVSRPYQNRKIDHVVRRSTIEEMHAAGLLVIDRNSSRSHLRPFDEVEQA